MTRDHSDAHKVRPVDEERPELDDAPAAVTSAPEEPPLAANSSAPVVQAIPVDSVAPAALAEPEEPFGAAAAFFIDATPLAQKSLEFWEENLGALIAHMENLAGVKTFEEAVTLQTRFATERFESFGRQSRDFAALTQQLASVGVAPLYGARAAA
jgi:hypothetical protein